LIATHRTRLFVTLASVAILLVATAGLAAGSITSKTIDVTTAQGAAVYGPTGFTGTITYSADEAGTAAQLADYICVHTPGAGAFVSYPGAYTLTVSGTGLAATSGSYSVGAGTCTGGENLATGSLSFTVPSDGVVRYSVTITGPTAVTAQTCSTLFAGFNTMRNHAYDTADGSHADSISVPPCVPGGVIPDAPFAALLLVTSGIGAAIFVARKNGLSFSRRAA
jgi:hypothetical protein